MAREERNPEGLVRRTNSDRGTTVVPVLTDAERARASIAHASAALEITGEFCPVHHTRLAHLGLGRPRPSGGHCEACSGHWSYSPRTGVVFIGPLGEPPRGGEVSGPGPVDPRPPPLRRYGAGTNGLGLYVAAEQIRKVIDAAEMMDKSAEAEHDVVETCVKILGIAVAIALGRKFGHGL